MANLVVKIPFETVIAAQKAARELRTHELEVEDLLNAEDYTISVEDNQAA